MAGENMKNRFLQLFVTAVMAGAFIITPVSAAPQDKVESLEQQKKQVEAQAADVNSELVNLLVEYNALQKDIENQKERIEQASDDLTAAETREKKQYEDMKLRIKYMYEEGDTSFIEALTTAKSYSELVSKSEYVQKVHAYDRKMLNEYVETKEEVKDLKLNLESGQAEMEAMSQDMEVQRTNMESSLQVMRSQIANFDSELEQAKVEATEELKRLEQATRVEAPKDTPQISKPQTGTSTKPKPETGNGGSENAADNNNGGSNNTSGDKSNIGGSNNLSGDKNNTDNNNTQNSNQTTSKPTNTALGQKIANTACQYIGNKYVYGGNSLTDGIDCSGFVYQIHKLFGISTPRNSTALRTGGKAVNYSDMLPGDVICYSGHVAIYIGGNTIVHASNSAPYPKGGIKTTSPANYRTVLAVRRYW